MSLSPGTLLSHHRIIEKIGAGGMGVVYKAKHTELGRLEAIKLLKPELVSNPALRQRFMREARAAAKVDHPNIATIYEVGEADGKIFMAMQFVEGETLRSLIRSGPIAVPKALDIATQVVSGLAKAHSAQVTHRDIKPENIIIGNDGLVKILDFGLAKLTEDREETNRFAATDADTRTEALTRKGQLLGTSYYMSPEQARGDPVDSRTDIFSFGVTLYEMLTGTRPFQGKSDIEVLTAIQRDPVTPVTRVNPRVSPHLQRIVAKCLEKNPSKRYIDTQQLVSELQELRADTTAPISGLVLELRQAVRVVTDLVRRRAVAVGAAVALSLAAVAAWYFSDGLPVPSPRLAVNCPGWVGSGPTLSNDKIAIFPFEVRASAELSPLGDGMVNLLTTKLDGVCNLRGVDPWSLIGLVERERNGPLE